MKVRFEGQVVIVTPNDPRPTGESAEDLEQALRDQLQAGRSVVIDGQAWREIDGLTLGVLIGAQTVFHRNGLQLKIASVDKAIESQLNPASVGQLFKIEPTVELAVAAIERTTHSPAASQ